MKVYDPRAGAREAVGVRRNRPAMALLHEAGTVVAYEPLEPHGMRADGEEFTLLAIIGPRPAAAKGGRRWNGSFAPS